MIPFRVGSEIDVKITWDELRILVIWAERWAAQYCDSNPEMTSVIRGIAARLQAQHTGLTPLTFFGEIKQLKKQFPDIEQNVVPE